MAALAVRITNSSPVAHGGKLEEKERTWGKVGGQREDLGLLDEMVASYKPQDISNSCENWRTDDADLVGGSLIRHRTVRTDL